MIVRVPASSANLGPGFDCLGLAWQLYNEIEFTHGAGLEVSGCDARYQKEENLAVRALRQTLARCGRVPEGLCVRFLKTEIPVSRGLGSSAALIVAGVLAANELYGLGLGREELLRCAAELEGHPDNVAPALFGGLTASLTAGGRAVTRRFPLSERLDFLLLVPPFELETKKARAVLPRSVPLEDAVYDLSRAAMLPRALEEGDMELLRLCLADRLHQPYRFPLVEGSQTALRLAMEHGAALCLSGAGPTLLCVNERGMNEALEKSLRAAFPAWGIFSARPSETGACVIH